jgi:hypothetical protein
LSFATAPDSLLSRRSVIFGAGLVAGLGVTAALPASAAAPHRALPGPDDPAECLKLYLKLTSDLSGNTVYGWHQDMLYGVTPGEITRPLLGAIGFGLGSTRPQADGSYQSLWKEVVFYTDLATGQIVDTWRNPYNGVECEVLHVHNAAVNMKLVPHLPDYAPLKASTGRDIGYSSVQTERDPTHPYYLPTSVIGDSVTMFSEARGHVPNKLDPKVWPRESTGDHYEVAEFYLNSGSLEALLDPRRTTIPCSGSWNRLAPWLPWMLMGGRGGQLFYRGVTQKLTRAEEIPEPLRSYTARHYPQFLVPPTDFNAPMESSWDVYMRERKPAPPL